MSRFQEIKHNLQIGAPKLKSDTDRINAQKSATTIELPLRFRGGEKDEHVSALIIRLQILVQDMHGHAAYAVHNTTTLTNGGKGWKLSPKQRLTAPVLFDLDIPQDAVQPMLLTVTAETGRDVNNPAVTIDLNLY